MTFAGAEIGRLSEAARIPLELSAASLDELSVELTGAADGFLNRRLDQMVPPPYKVRQKLTRIREAFDRLLGLLDDSADVKALVVTEVDIAPMSNASKAYRQRRDLFDDAVATVKDLRHCWLVAETKVTAKVAEKRAVERPATDGDSEAIAPAKRKSTYKGDPAMQGLINELADIWRRYWGKRPGASLNTKDDAGGPFVRFIQEYLRIVDEQLTPEELEMDRTLRNALRAPPQAIRERIRNVPVRKVRAAESE